MTIWPQFDDLRGLGQDGTDTCDTRHRLRAPASRTLGSLAGRAPLLAVRMGSLAPPGFPAAGVTRSRAHGSEHAAFATRIGSLTETLADEIKCAACTKCQGSFRHRPMRLVPVDTFAMATSLCKAG